MFIDVYTDSLMFVKILRLLLRTPGGNLARLWGEFSSFAAAVRFVAKKQLACQVYSSHPKVTSRFSTAARLSCCAAG